MDFYQAEFEKVDEIFQKKYEDIKVRILSIVLQCCINKDGHELVFSASEHT